VQSSLQLDRAVLTGDDLFNRKITQVADVEYTWICSAPEFPLLLHHQALFDLASRLEALACYAVRHAG
jgi:hypothetical protein